METHLEQTLAEIRSGNRRALSRAISLVENNATGATPLLKLAFPHTGQATVIGITGAPGAGKSSLVNGLCSILRGRDKTVAIVAVDPSSPFSGGAILGDRVRMQRHATDDGIYIRSMATRGNLGGLSRSTADVVTLLDAAGFDYILIETVGVGQDEVDIVRTAYLSIVVLVPGMGDDIQAIKAGIMEIGDIFVINKADREGVLKTEQEIRALLAMNDREDGWNPPVVQTVAIQDKGLEELFQAIEELEDFQRARGSRGRFALRSTEERLVQMARDRLFEDFLAASHLGDHIAETARRVLDKSVDPYSVIEDLIRQYKSKGAQPCSKK